MSDQLSPCPDCGKEVKIAQFSTLRGDQHFAAFCEDNTCCAYSIRALTPESAADRHERIAGKCRWRNEHPDRYPPVLDVCCGSKMFWFDKNDPRALYLDNRNESHTLKDSSSKGGERKLVIKPDLVADFTQLPFKTSMFPLVVFDPPHLKGCGSSGWLSKKYGKLDENWRAVIRDGFSECFRVLKPHGTLVFKWNETDIPLSEVLKLTPQLPLFGHKSGKQQGTHWVAFLKNNNE